MLGSRAITKHMAEFFMWKLIVNFPALAFIELNRPNIRLDHPKAKCLVSATAYLRFSVRE